MAAGGGNRKSSKARKGARGAVSGRPSAAAATPRAARRRAPRRRAAAEPASITDLVPAKRNPRRRTDANLALLRRSIERFGLGRSVVIDEHGELISGHGTTQVAGELGKTKLQVVDVDGDTLVAVRLKGLTAKQKAELAVLDNRSAEAAEWDPDVLAVLAGQGVPLEEAFGGAEALAAAMAVEDSEPEEGREVRFTAKAKKKATCPSCGEEFTP